MTAPVAPVAVAPAAAPVAPAVPAAAPAAPNATPSANELVESFRAARKIPTRAADARPGPVALPPAQLQVADPNAAPSPEQAAVQQVVDAAAAAVAAEADPNAPPVDPNAPPVAEGVDPDAPEKWTVSLPGRNAGDDLEVEVDDPILAQRVQQLSKGYMRGEQARQVLGQAEGLQREANEVREVLLLDPVGFIGNYLPPEQRAEVALGTLLAPEIWQEIAPVLINLLQDPNAAATARAQFETRRLQHKEQIREQREEHAGAQRHAQELLSGIQRLTPMFQHPQQAPAFQADLRAYVREYSNTHGLERIPLEQLPAIVAPRLVAWGIDPAAAFAHYFRPAPPQQMAPNRPAPRAPAGAAHAPAPAAPVAPGAARVVAATQKQALAAAAPPGAGASAMTIPTVPKKMTIKEKAAWFRQQVGIATGPQ